jgi:hypothetical protein
MSTKKEALKLAGVAGLHVETWSPGDGATRYRVFERPSAYHAGGELYTALGSRDLLSWVHGYLDGSGMKRWPSFK